MNEQPKSIIDLLKTVDHTEDKEISFVLAATMNLYIETLRRMKGRVLLGPADVRNILDIAFILIRSVPDQVGYHPENVRARELSQEEADSVMKGIIPDKVARRV